MLIHYSKFLTCLLAIFILSGCMTFTKIENGLTALEGKHIDRAVSVLGYPSGTQTFGNKTIYLWSVSRNGTLVLPQTQSTTGYVGNTPIYGTTTTNQFVPVNYNCLIKIIVNSSERIISWEYQGNVGGCNQYASRLGKLSDRSRTTLHTVNRRPSESRTSNQEANRDSSKLDGSNNGSQSKSILIEASDGGGKGKK